MTDMAGRLRNCLMELNGVLLPSNPTRPLKLYLVGLEGEGLLELQGDILQAFLASRARPL